MIPCPICHKPGGVELLTSVSPCDACLAPRPKLSPKNIQPPCPRRATWEPFTRPINRCSNVGLTILYASVQTQLAVTGAALPELRAKRGGWR